MFSPGGRGRRRGRRGSGQSSPPAGTVAHHPRPSFQALDRNLQDVKDQIAATEADIAQLREDAGNKDAVRRQHEVRASGWCAARVPTAREDCPRTVY